MEQTAIQPGAPKHVESAVQSGPPPGGINGTALQPGPKPAKHPLRQILEVAADLRITVALFVMAMLIVFWGTLAQVDNGVGTVMAKYFRSFFVLVPLKVVLFNAVDESAIVVPFPGGWLVGSVMLVNLLAAHAIRFKLAWNRAGILLIHSGLIVIMLGEVVTGMCAVEGQMPILIGQSTNVVTHPGTSEFVVIKTLDAKRDEITAVPKARLAAGAVIDDANLPFKFAITRYMVNSDYRAVPAGAIDPNARGHARMFEAVEIPEANGVDPNQRHDVPAMYATLTSRDGKDLGKWLFSAHLENQWITVGNETYQVALRFKQTKRDFTFQLTDFKHDVYPGTNKPKDFHSYIRLIDPTSGVDEAREIYMNAPLYHQGETFYQSSWTTDRLTNKANGTVLQVVHNPGWLMPYLACFLVGVGLLAHFGLVLYKFLDRRVVR
jgi:ResB-like family